MKVTVLIACAFFLHRSGGASAGVPSTNLSGAPTRRCGFAIWPTSNIPPRLARFPRQPTPGPANSYRPMEEAVALPTRAANRLLLFDCRCCCFVSESLAPLLFTDAGSRELQLAHPRAIAPRALSLSGSVGRGETVSPPVPP